MIARRDRFAGTDDIVVLDIPLLRPVHREMLDLAAVVVVDAPTELALERLVDPAGHVTRPTPRPGSARQADRADPPGRAPTSSSTTPATVDQLRAEVDRVWAALVDLRGRGAAGSPPPSTA